MIMRGAKLLFTKVADRLVQCFMVAIKNAGEVKPGILAVRHSPTDSVYICLEPIHNLLVSIPVYVKFSNPDEQVYMAGRIQVVDDSAFGGDLTLREDIFDTRRQYFDVSKQMFTEVFDKYDYPGIALLFIGGFQLSSPRLTGHEREWVNINNEKVAGEEIFEFPFTKNFAVSDYGIGMQTTQIGIKYPQLLAAEGKMRITVNRFLGLYTTFKLPNWEGLGVIRISGVGRTDPDAQIGAWWISLDQYSTEHLNIPTDESPVITVYNKIENHTAVVKIGTAEYDCEYRVLKTINPDGLKEMLNDPTVEKAIFIKSKIG